MIRTPRACLVLPLCLSALAPVGPASAGNPPTCDPDWLDNRLTNDPRGGGGQAVQVFNGSVYLGQATTFPSNGQPTRGLVRAVGTEWKMVGGGLSSAANIVSVFSLTVWDRDGAAPQPSILVAGGIFDGAGGAPFGFTNLVAWDREDWVNLGGGPLPGPVGGLVRTVISYDFDGAGPQPPSLIVGGHFSGIGGNGLAGKLAVFNDTIGAWLQTNLDLSDIDFVGNLRVIDPDGPGPIKPSLFALCGTSSESTRCIRWFNPDDGWAEFGPALPSVNPGDRVFDVAAFDIDGPGPQPVRVVAAGTVFGPHRVAWFHPVTETWNPLPGAPANVFARSDVLHGALAVVGSPPRLAIARRPINPPNPLDVDSMFVFDGSSFVSVPDLALNESVSAFEGRDDPAPRHSVLLAGLRHEFPMQPPLRETFTFHFDGSTLAPVPDAAATPFALPGETITAISSFDDDGLGPNPSRLIVATLGQEDEEFGPISHFPFKRWTGRAFETYPPGEFLFSICCVPVRIRAMIEFDPDGPGFVDPGFVAAGDFDEIDGQAAHKIALFHPSFGWEPLASTMQPFAAQIRCLASTVEAVPHLPPGLFAGGSFTSINGVSASNAAIWTGGEWTPLGPGLNGPVNDAVVFDPDGEGAEFDPELYVTGDFTMAGATPVSRIARWNGSQWQALGLGLDGTGRALHLWDADGGGGAPPILVVGGSFTLAGGVPRQGIAGYSTFWTGLGDAAAGESALALTNLSSYGTGDNLYALFAAAGGQRRFVRLEPPPPLRGTSPWPTVADLGTHPAGTVHTLLTIDDDGPGLNTQSIVIAGPLPAEIDGVAADNLIRLAGPQVGLVVETAADLNSLDAYLCQDLPGPSDPVIFDFARVNGNPDTIAGATITSPLSIGSLNFLSGSATISQSSSGVLTLTSNTPGAASLLLGDGPLAPIHSAIIGSAGGPRSIVSARDVVVARCATDGFVVQELFIQDVDFRADGDVLVSPEGRGGYLVIVGARGSMTSRQDVRLAQAQGSFGGLRILFQSRWDHVADNATTLEVAGDGEGILDIDLGAQAFTNFTDIVIASGPLGRGSVNMGESASAQWTQTGGGVFVGHQGEGLMTIRNGSVFVGNDCHVIVGHLAGSTGTLALSADPPASSLLIANEVSIGRYDGFGCLLLDNSLVNASINAYSVTVGRNGIVEGAGRINVADRLYNRGVVSPGSNDSRSRTLSAIGEIAVMGGYQQLSAVANEGVPGRLVIDVAGAIPGEHDALTLGGIAELGGTLDVRFAPGFVPVPGQFSEGIDVLRCAGLLGRFEVANFPGLPAAATGAPRFLRLEYRADPLRGFMTAAIVETVLVTLPPSPGSPQNYPIGGVGTSAATGDLNLDGRADVAVTIPDAIDPFNNPGSIAILFNGGNTNGFWNGFTSTVQITVAPFPSSVQIADFDGVNGRDIAFASLATNSVHVLLNDGMGNFTFLRGDLPPIPVTGSPIQLIVSDYNRDGGPDIAVVTRDDNTLTVLFNRRSPGGDFLGFGDTETIPIPPVEAQGVNVDADNDKWDEVVLPSPDTQQAVMINNNGPLLARRGMPVFNPAPILIPVPGGPVAVAAADIDLDGFNDLAIATRDANAVAVLLGDGTLFFSAPLSVPAGTEPSRVVLAALDEDADPDIAVITTNNDGQRVVRVIRNDLFGGQLNFAPQADLLPGAPPQVLLADDVTGDGRTDLITVNDSGGVRTDRGASDNDLSVFTFSVCLGDADNDRIVGMKDIAETLMNFGAVYLPGTGPGDANGDGLVTFRDLTITLVSWGRACD